MKLLITGHSVVDHIYTVDGEIVAPGGIYYSSIGFHSMKKEEDEIFLLTSISKDDHKFFQKVFEKFNLNYAVKYDSVPHVNLFVDGSAERREHYRNLIKNLAFKEKIDFNSFDGIYINMITGGDLLPEQFEEIRNNFTGQIYLDVHTLSRGTGKEHHRHFRKIEKYKSYLSNADIVQVNENELKTITPFDDIKSILNEVFEIGVKLLIITKGEKGVEAYSQSGQKFSIDAIKLKSINNVGCGDIFGSVFFYNYIANQNINRSLKIANAAAGTATTFKSADELMRLNYDIIKRHIEE